MKHIPLTQSKFAIVDDTDFDWLNQWKWCASKCGNVWYACRRMEKGKNVYMHREILHLKHNDKKQVDHINHNELDDRRCNLRICSFSENQYNRRKQKSNSNFKGATWSKFTKRWQAQIQCGKRYFLGRFNSEIEAAMAYDKAAKKLFGKFAYLNFPNKKIAKET